MADDREPGSLTALWPLTLPVLPVLVGLLWLQVIGVPSAGVPFAAPDPGNVAYLHHGRDRLLFAAAASIHATVCIAAVIYFAFVLIRWGGARRRRLGAVACAIAAAFVAAMVALGGLNTPPVIHAYTYFQIADLLRPFAVAAELSGTVAGAPVLSVFVVVPTVLGVIAVMAASAAATAVVLSLPLARSNGDKSGIRQAVNSLLHCFYALSGVLVTSTITAHLFFHLPAGLFAAAAPPPLAEAVKGYVGGLGTFWAAVFTLTLFAVFAGPVAVVYIHVRRIVAGDDRGVAIAEWLTGQGISLSFGESVKNVLVLIAPLLVGPLADILKLFGG